MKAESFGAAKTENPRPKEMSGEIGANSNFDDTVAGSFDDSLPHEETWSESPATNTVAVESWSKNATAEAYAEYQEPPEVIAYNEQKQKYLETISQWDNYINTAVADDGHELSEEELHSAIDVRERMKQEMIEVSADYPGDWTGLLYKRMTDPITKEKFITQRQEAMPFMKEGPVPEMERGNKYSKRYQEHYQAQIENYDARISEIFSSTEVRDGGSRATSLGEGNIDKTGTVFKDAHKGGIPLTDRQKNITEAHEKLHGTHDAQAPTDKAEIRSVIDTTAVEQLNNFYREQKAQGAETKFNMNYLSHPDEITARMSQFKNYFGMGADDTFTKQHLDYIRSHYVADTDLDNGVSDLLYVITPETEKAFLDVINIRFSETKTRSCTSGFLSRVYGWSIFFIQLACSPAL